jgi:hypothetical protein
MTSSISPTSISTLALAVGILLLPATQSHADSSQGDWQQLFNQLDLNRDGLLSRSEYERAGSLQISDISAQPAQAKPGSASTKQNPYLALVPNPNPPPTVQNPLIWPFGSTASTAGTNGSALPSFEALDLDRSGYLSTIEAIWSYPLVQQWRWVDANRNGVIERAEFSAFESVLGR